MRLHTPDRKGLWRAVRVIPGNFALSEGACPWLDVWIVAIDTARCRNVRCTQPMSNMGAGPNDPDA